MKFGSQIVMSSRYVISELNCEIAMNFLFSSFFLFTMWKILKFDDATNQKCHFPTTWWTNLPYMHTELWLKDEEDCIL